MEPHIVLLRNSLFPLLDLWQPRELCVGIDHTIPVLTGGLWVMHQLFIESFVCSFVAVCSILRQVVLLEVKEIITISPDLSLVLSFLIFVYMYTHTYIH